MGHIEMLTDVPVRSATLFGSEGGCLPGGPSPVDEGASAGA